VGIASFSLKPVLPTFSPGSDPAEQSEIIEKLLR
jgi:hypothetical protein